MNLEIFYEKKERKKKIEFHAVLVLVISPLCHVRKRPVQARERLDRSSVAVTERVYEQIFVTCFPIQFKQRFQADLS